MSYIGQAPGLGQRTAFRFVAVAGQTTFSGPDAQGYPMGYTPRLVDVYLNGRLLSEPDYTAADGSTIILGQGLSVGDELRVLAQAPFSPANTYTMAQSDSFQRRRNRIVDPGMRVSQEQGNNLLTTVSTVPLYASDAFLTYRAGSTGGASVQRIALATPGGSPYRLRTTVTAANATPAATDVLEMSTRIEGIDVADLKLGTVSAKTLAVRLGIRTSVSGQYTVTLRNGVYNRTWMGPITIQPAEVGQDVVKTITGIPGDVAGTWAIDNTIGLVLSVTLAAGSSTQGVLGWQAGNLNGLASSTNLMATNGATFDLFDVGLYDVTGLQQGVIPPFELESFTNDVQRCQRYYCKSYDLDTVPGTTTASSCIALNTQASNSYHSMPGELGCTMRTIPSVTLYSTANGLAGYIFAVGSSNVPGTANTIGTRKFSISVVNTPVASTVSLQVHFTANARL